MRWGLVLLASESKKESKSSTKNCNVVILSGFDVLNFVIFVNVFGDCFGCLWWKKKWFHIIWFLTPCKLIFMFSEFAHLRVLFNVLETWSYCYYDFLFLFLFLGFIFFLQIDMIWKRLYKLVCYRKQPKIKPILLKIHVAVWARIVPT